MWDFYKQNSDSIHPENLEFLQKTKLYETSSLQTHSLYIPTSSTGKASVSYTIPDTVTEWKASAFCVEESAGFGISVPATLTAFQPFFVDLTLPYSIIHGEDFLLRANVFNYLNHCIKVCTSAHPSNPYPASKQSAGFVIWKTKQIDRQTIKQKRVSK